MNNTSDVWLNIEEVCSLTRVVFKTKINEGTTHTLNQLLNEAQGEYVYIIASDDIAKSGAIEKEVDFLNNNLDYALVVGNDEFIDSEGNVCYWNNEQNVVYSKEEASYLSFGEYLQKNRNFNFLSSDFGTYKTLYIGNYIPNGFLIRKSIFEKTGYFTLDAPLEDYYLMLQISKYAKMKYLDEILFSYRWHNSNTAQNRTKMEQMTNITRSYEEQILNSLDDKAVLKEVLDVKKYGVSYKKKGIPFLFQILTYKKFDKKIKRIKLFNINILQYIQ